MEKLGFNPLIKFCDALKFFWKKETHKTQRICHEIAQLIAKEEPIVVLAVIEAIEATGNVASIHSAQVTQELQKITKQEYRYFGQYHLNRENGHITGIDDVEDFLSKIELSQEEKAKSFQVVDKVFEIFTEAMNEMMTYAKNHPIEENLKVPELIKH